MDFDFPDFTLLLPFHRIILIMIGKPRGRYARVAFELTLRNLGLATLPGQRPSGADH